MVILNLIEVTGRKKDIRINNVNLKLEKGESGQIWYKEKEEKNLLLELIYGVTKLSSGRIQLSEKDNKSNKRFEKMGLVHEDYKLISTKTVSENLIFPLLLSKNQSGKEVFEKRVMESLEVFGLSDKKDEYITKLTEREKKLLTIARSLICNPEQVILDNIYKDLSKEEGDSLVDFFQNLTLDGVVVLFITEEDGKAEELSENQFRLRNGRLESVSRN